MRHTLHDPAGTGPYLDAARHLGLRVVGLSCITNMAAGVLAQTLHHQEVLDVAERVKERLLDVLARIVQEAAKGTRELLPFPFDRHSL